MNQADGMTAQSSVALVSNVLERTGTEIAVLAEQASTFQSEVGTLVEGKGQVPAHILSAIQSLDEMTQKLECISGYLQSLSALTPEDWSLDVQSALAVVSLQELQDRLGGTAPADPENASAENECEFF